MYKFAGIFLAFALIITTPSVYSVQGDISFLSKFDNAKLVDQKGQLFSTTQLQNQVVLFSFIFTGCNSTCPIQTKALSQVLKSLPQAVRNQVRFVSVSIDPGNDTPEKMQRFAQKMDADLEGWLFLTGDVIKLQNIARDLHLLSENEPNSPQIHRTSLWLLDKRGRMLQRYRGNPPDQERLIRELIQVSQLPISDS